MSGFIAALRPLRPGQRTAGFNVDFHAIRHHGTNAILESHYVRKRSQRTRAVLTFFAQDHASAEMVYANADITKAQQSREILAFADYWHQATGAHPGLLVFDSQRTTYTVLDELTGQGITWLTLRMRGKAELARLAALPACDWRTVRIERPGRYRHPPRRPVLRPTPERRPGHHPDRHRRQPLPAPGQTPASLRHGHPGQDLAALPRRDGHLAHHHRHRHLRPESAQLPPSPHRRRLRRTGNPDPVVGRPQTPLHVPTTLIPSTKIKPQPKSVTGNRGQHVGGAGSSAPAAAAASTDELAA
ncbi:hypothetical protein ACIA5D_13565 [Actinoplanes sp. NPDC051513]|uniref:hypothetical protein n=1 Tax=Actinoplanes sp. NPDC051513 TaxID=3363908 RepID=UPI0037A78F3E